MKRTICPTCRKSFPATPHRETFPFCSPQCKNVDLGNWLDGRYRIAAQDDEIFSESTAIDGSEQRLPTDEKPN